MPTAGSSAGGRFKARSELELDEIGIVRSVVSGIEKYRGESAVPVAARQGAVDLTALAVTHAAMDFPLSFC